MNIDQLEQYIDTREAWLQRAAGQMQDWLRQATGKLQPSVHVSMGFPAASQCRLDKVLGGCFSAEFSIDGNPHIFISPIMAGDPAASQGVLATLLHELIHAMLGSGKGHGKEFQRVAATVGLQPPWKATTAGEQLLLRLRALADSLGAWEHSAIKLPEKKKRKSKASELLLGDSLGKEARIIIPSEDKDGNRLGASVLAKILDEAAKLFGGYTTWIANGGWIAPNGKLVQEAVNVIDIAAPADPASKLKLEKLAEQILADADQWSVYLRLPDGRVESIGEDK